MVYVAKNKINMLFTLGARLYGASFAIYEVRR